MWENFFTVLLLLDEKAKPVPVSENPCSQANIFPNEIKFILTTRLVFPNSEKRDKYKNAFHMSTNTCGKRKQNQICLILKKGGSVPLSNSRKGKFVLRNLFSSGKSSCMLEFLWIAEKEALIKN